MSDCKLICAIKDNVKDAINIPGRAADNVKTEEINEIIIPNGLKSIGGNSFAGWGFETITIPSSVELIRERAFQGCPNLEKIEVAKGNNKISMEVFAFSFCPNLENLSIYSNNAIIGSRAFESCKKLETVVIKGANARIFSHAFINCENLKTLNIPENAEVAEGAFRGCDKVPDKYKGQG